MNPTVFLTRPGAQGAGSCDTGSYDPASFDTASRDTASRDTGSRDTGSRAHQTGGSRLAPGFATIPEALAAMRAGLPVLVLDDENRENEGDVVLAGATLDTRWLAWTIRHSSGYLCAPMPGAWADRLALPPMVADNQDPRATAYTITCDAATGISTGISAADRTRTIRLLADPATRADDLIRPGHVVPLRARVGGVLSRRGHTEACVDLCTLAGLPPVGVIGELVHDEGSMMRTPDVVALGATHGLPVVTIEALVTYRRTREARQPAETAGMAPDLAGGAGTLADARDAGDAGDAGGTER